VNPSEKRALEDIETYGCHVLHVLEENELPRFSYSLGIQRLSRAPEIVVVGLKRPLAHWVVNEYNRRVRAGESFLPGVLYSGFLEGFDVRFEAVERQHYREYFGWARWLYDGDKFDVVQLIYPSTSGVWPWDGDAEFTAFQPLLCRDPRAS